MAVLRERVILPAMWREHRERISMSMNEAVVEQLRALVSQWRTRADELLKAITDPDDPDAKDFTGHADGLREAADELEAVVTLLLAEERPQLEIVTMPDGSPVAAPCAISGCQYDVSEARTRDERIADLQRQLLAGERRPQEWQPKGDAQS